MTGWLYESAVVSCDVILSQRKIFLEKLFKNNAHFLDGTYRTFVEEECCIESLQSVEKRIGTAGVLVALKDKLNETFHSVLFHCLFLFVSLPLSLSLISACRCNKYGSTDITCDKETGNCKCKRGFRGRKCNACPLGKFNFPTCSRMSE